VHVPLIVAGATIPHGAHQTGALVHAVDLWRTVADLTGASEARANPLPLDSISFRNQLANPGAPSARTEIFCQGFANPGAYRPTSVGPYEADCQDTSAPAVFNWMPQNLGSHGRSLNDGHYKLIVVQTVAGQDGQPAGSPDTPPQYQEELYDLLLDPEELTDLMPQVAGNPTLAAIHDQLRARITQISGY
jgi:arylsulfatase A-like enzyme